MVWPLPAFKWLKQVFASKEVIGLSYPDVFNFSIDGGPKRYFMVYLYAKGSRRSYRIDLDKRFIKQLPWVAQLDYWVTTGTFKDPIWDKRIDWKVSPRDLKKRYLAELIKE